jgi:hypothetical protein
MGIEPGGAQLINACVDNWAEKTGCARRDANCAGGGAKRGP